VKIIKGSAGIFEKNAWKQNPEAAVLVQIYGEMERTLLIVLDLSGQEHNPCCYELEEMEWGCGLHSSGLGLDPVVSYCEHGSKPTGQMEAISWPAERLPVS
jgi:hypothetical protein